MTAYRDHKTKKIVTLNFRHTFLANMKRFIYLIAPLLCLGCNNSNENQGITFIGDSIISRWDIERYFFSYKIENLGLPGSGIDYIEQFNPKNQNNTVVVLTGTNDLYKINSDNMDDYAQRYAEAILNIDANKIILTSILPRNLDDDTEDINSMISRINNLIFNKIKNHKKITYLNVYPDFIKDGTLNMNFSYDGLHINEYGYELISRKIKTIL